MDKHQDTGESWSFNWGSALYWAGVSFLLHFVLATFGNFVLGDHVGNAEIISVSIAVGIVNGATDSQFFDSLPATRLCASHWLIVALIIAACGYGGVFLGGELMGNVMTFSLAATIVGMPMGYVVMKLWVSRPAAPQGHPDNISD